MVKFAFAPIQYIIPALLAAALTVGGASAGAGPATASSTSSDPPICTDGPSSSASTSHGPHPFALVSTRDTTASSEPNAATYNFHTATMDQLIIHDFTLKNVSTYTVQIGRLQASCGCTTADAGTAGTQSSSKTFAPLAPGQTITVHVTVDAADTVDGPTDKVVSVYLAGEPEPSYDLHLVGTLVPVVSADPSYLDFGAVRCGKSPSLTFRVTNATHAYPHGVPTPTVGDPQLILTPAGAPVTTADGSSVTRAYTVRLSPDTSIGDFQSLINVPAPRGTDPLPITVRASVEGDLSCKPAAVAFGAVSPGQTATEQVTLTGVSADALAGLKVCCADPTLRACIVPAPASPAQCLPPTTAILKVTFSPRTNGSFASNVTVTTRSGERLDLPAWAYVGP
ncbi:MAG: DUF1573 domain-containing protein [Capsulimonadaceae bacterium]